MLDALFGAEEEFEYTSTTSINGLVARIHSPAPAPRRRLSRWRQPTKERELSGEKAASASSTRCRESVARRGAARLDLRARRPRGGRQPRPPPLLLSAPRSRLLVEVVRRDAEIRVVPPRRAAGRAAKTVDDVIRRPARQPHRPDREHEPRLLPAPLRACSAPAGATPRSSTRLASCSTAPAPMSPRSSRRRSARGVLSLRYGRRPRSSPTCSRSATASPSRRSPSRAATIGRGPWPPGRGLGAVPASPGSDPPHSPLRLACEKLADQPMRESMSKLAGFLGRRRRWILAGWVARPRPRPALCIAPDRPPDRRRIRRSWQPVEGGSAGRSNGTSPAAPTASWCCCRRSPARARPSAPRRSAGSARAVARLDPGDAAAGRLPAAPSAGCSAPGEAMLPLAQRTGPPTC